MVLAPVDPAVSVPLALSGRIVTMDSVGTVLPFGVLYARDGGIVDILPVGAPPPAGFEQVPVTPSRGTLYPGLIELHNHLPYNVLGLWPVPRKFTNRDQWTAPSTPEYKRLVSGPMRVLGSDPDLVAAIVRYVEMRALLGGTTTSQGVALAKSHGMIGHFRGLVRNVESTGDPRLRPAGTHIADIEARDAEKFLARISGGKKWILHLSEGVDSHAHDAFQSLDMGAGRWAITPNLIGIHCLGLAQTDFETLARHGGSMVWSPLSNMLLYGQTADVGAALAAGVPVALGSDWAPSGSKNLLGELKVARIVADTAGVELSDRDLVAMATRTPAVMLGWGQHLGTLEKGKMADVLVLSGTRGNPYRRLVGATERDISLVMINGVPRVATPAVMAALVPGHTGAEQVSISGRRRVLNLKQVTADPTVEAVSVAEAISRLQLGLASLGEPSLHTAALRRAGVSPAVGRLDLAQRAAITAAKAFEEGRALLAASQFLDNQMSPRPLLAIGGRAVGATQRTGARLAADETTRTGADTNDERASFPAARSPAAAQALAPDPIDPVFGLKLDPLTAVDNAPFYIEQLATNSNLPPVVRDLLIGLAPSS